MIKALATIKWKSIIYTNVIQMAIQQWVEPHLELKKTKSLVC